MFIFCIYQILILSSTSHLLFEFSIHLTYFFHRLQKGQ